MKFTYVNNIYKICEIIKCNYIYFKFNLEITSPSIRTSAPHQKYFPPLGKHIGITNKNNKARKFIKKKQRKKQNYIKRKNRIERI